MQNRSLFTLLLLGMIITLSSCAKIQPKAEETLPDPQTLYQEAEKAFELQKYDIAAENFSKIYLEYPYTTIATKSKLMEALSFYEKQDFDMALVTLEDFIKLHPAYPEISLAYYLRAMSHYSRISDSKHDQLETELAKNAINEMIMKFPNETYSRDLKLKLDLVNDHLAGHEMEIARFYQKNQDLVSAINRFNIVVKEYSTTNHAKEALSRLVECYLALGIIEEAKKIAAILGTNYPQSNWYLYSYNLIKKFEK